MCRFVVASRACVMTGVGETLLPLSLAENALRDGQPLRSRGDQGRVRRTRLAQRRTAGRRHRRVLQATAWPEDGASLEDWVEALAASTNDLEAPATRIQPVIGEVIAALNATNGAWLARMSGSGATCFAIYENTADARRAAEQDPRLRTRLPAGGCMPAIAELARAAGRRASASEMPSPAMNSPEPCRRSLKANAAWRSETVLRAVDGHHRPRRHRPAC